MQLIHYIKILRPINLLISICCIYLCAFILDKMSIHLLPLIFAISALVGFANIINDIIDYKVDQANRLSRPISSNVISIQSAVRYAILLLCFACIIIIMNFNYITQLLIFTITLPLIILYTPIFKKIPLIGNLVVSLILSMVFIVTSTYLLGYLDYLIIPPIILSFFLMTIREIVKDIADLEGDKKFHITTLPVKFGINISILVIYILTMFFFVSYFMIYYYYDSYGLFYLFSVFIFILCPLLIFLYQLSKNKSSIYCIYLSKVLKLLTIFGVIVIYLINI